ncbi:MAG: GNAT family N-acetyltransferase [Candidatus Zixiibacteriota bacterium]
MQLVPFENHHVIPWQKAIDRTGISPGPTSGPEYGSSMDVSWRNTFIFEAGDLFLPFSLRKSNQFKVIPTANYAGAQINSLLGVKDIDSSVFDRLAMLPKGCVITLQLPQEIYTQHKHEFDLLKFDYQSSYDYHMIPLRDSYDEWFNRKAVERRFIRKAERENVEIRFGKGETLQTFYDVYQHSVQRWQKQDPHASFHRQDRMARLFSYPDSRVEIAIAFYNDTPIAGAIFGQYDETGAYLFGGFNYEYQHLRAMYLVHATIVKRMTGAGVRLYSHGLSLGRKSLEHFKESLGAERRPAVIIVRHRFPRLKHFLVNRKLLSRPSPNGAADAHDTI